MRIIIALLGLKGSGKGTSGDYLDFTHNFHRESFAKPLKNMCADIFGWERHLVEGETQQSRAWRELPDPYWSERLGFQITPRSALQLIGTEVMRENFHQSIWVDSLVKRVQTSRHDRIVITDCRYQNEAEAIKKIGGVVVRVTRGTPPPWWYEAAAAAERGGDIDEHWGVHSSEWMQAGITPDYTITNDKGLGELELQLDALVDTITQKRMQEAI